MVVDGDTSKVVLLEGDLEIRLVNEGLEYTRGLANDLGSCG